MNEQIIARAEEFLSNREILENGCGECCVLAQIDPDGFPTAASISPVKIDGIKRVYFCSFQGSNWVKRAQNCSYASICFNSQEKHYNITLVGTMNILTDIKTKTEMWYKGLEGYFKGPEDDDFCVLEFVTLRYSLKLSEHDSNSVARGSL